MGLFKRSAPGASPAAPAVPLSVRRAHKLEAQGTPANGVITGMRFSLNDDTARDDYVVTVLGTGARHAVRVTTAVAHRFRLGLPVVLKDERGVVFDWEAMFAAWELGDRYVGQDSLRRVPDDGIEDTALDVRVQRHLRKWSPVRATVMSVTRTSMFGLQTVNFDVELELADGTHALSKRDNVPSYARWWAAPGAVVPAVVDPDDITRANVDWRAFALSKVEEVGFDDAPIEGSIAAVLEQPEPEAPVMSAATATVDPSAPVTLDMSMSSWVTARRGGQMSEREFEKALIDWREAGMCTEAQVEAARAAAQAL
jgi:hypothetical protein